MAWHLRAHYTETCSCNMFCPCWFGLPEYMVMDQGWCATTLLFRVEEGNADGVDLAGRVVVVALDFPGPTMFDGDATARLYIEAAASEEQAHALESIFRGESGGPMELINGLVSTWLPTVRTQIEASRDGDTVTARVGDAGEITSTALRDQEGRGFTLAGGGFIAGMGMTEGELAPGRGTRWSDPELPRAFASDSGIRGTVAWAA